MYGFIRFCTGLALAVGFFAGCVSQESTRRAAILALPYKEFDQAFGSGWRPLLDRGEGLKAAVLVEDYLKSHRELTPGEQKFLHLHAAQLFALEGKNRRPVKHLDEAVSPLKTEELWSDWNDFIAATKAFLTQDRASLIAARERLAAAKAPRLKIAERLLEKFGSSYGDVIWWIRLCPGVAVAREASTAERSAAEKLAKAFGFPLTVGLTNSPECCIRVERRSFAPNSGSMGYIIIHSSDGTLITASSQEWLDEAVDRLIKSSREWNGIREAPFGLATSFSLAR